MANVNLCGVCGSEIFTGNDAGEAFVIGYCECNAVPEVEAFGLEIEDESFIYVYEQAEVLAASAGCGSCGQAGCEGPNENGYCLEQYQEEEDTPEPNRRPREVGVLGIFLILKMLVLMMWDVATYKENEQGLVIGFYGICINATFMFLAVILYIVL